ncbi:hypothetical protein DWB61_16680 [Ancylomarina euxinus]|uniref:Uncharacterized protein n=1 Tax=Ancylomarina euxinus TaxID=2283627 RepID=A0A425XWS3_9BACT|nr:outer membrane beta-barrel protein [Ancylomarina euxinus]MCZ4696330.1 outer membrane beta-barrel protein [Ancylomarina euxinus]MUP16705.1 outer membrane beta-barrel protein [Ancylomarina euxinus]RRG19089.1 hypothetical protein DWB61_16680 [Ancylomarina euxinus]
MLRDKGHIDKIFSDGLKDLSVQPSADLWGKINADIKLGRRRKRAAVILISLAAAASLALLFTLSDNLLFQQNVKVYQDKALAEIKINPNPENARIKSVATDNEVGQLADAVIQSDSKSESQRSVILPLSSYDSCNIIQKRERGIEIVLPKSKENIIGNSTLTMKLFNSGIKDRKVSSSVLVQDSLMIARNLRMLAQFDKAEGKKKEWSILGQVSSSYSSYKGDKSGDKSENGLISIGGGVKLNWQTGKKLAIQTGIIYNKFGQQLANDNQIFDGVTFNNVFTKQVDLDPVIESSAGKIVMKGRSSLYSSNETFVSRSSSSSDMIQSFEAIEIPFILRYSLLDKKFGLHLSGGLSTNLMIGNRVYDKNTRETIGETSGIRSTNFSTSFSLGMEYQLSSKLSLSMEPAFKYYLNSINTDSNFNYKPYSIGLNSGVRYKF